MYGIYVLICLPSLSLAYSVVNSYDIVLNDSTVNDFKIKFFVYFVVPS